MKKRFSKGFHLIVIFFLAISMNLVLFAAPGLTDTTLRVMSAGDLKILDPIFTTNSVTI